MASLKLRKFALCSLAGILTFACSQSGQNSRPQSQGYQSTVEGKAIVISLNQDFKGSSLFTRADKAAADRPVFTGINLDSISDSRVHFPDYVEKWVNSSGVSFKVKVCDGFTASIDPSNCLNDSTLPDYFAGSDPAEVTRAILEALQLLTYGDLVPGCYLEKLRATEAFETTITSVSVPTARARIKQVLTSSLFSTCKDVKRSLWPTTAPCSNLNLNGTYQSLRNAIVDKAQTNASIRNTYADRYRLALRLGVDEFKDFQEKSDLVEINPFPSSLDAYTNDFKCINANLGDNLCIWGPSLIPGLKSESSRHFYVTVDKDLQLILGQDQNLNGDKDYAELLWAAVRLAKATNLNPMIAIKALETEAQVSAPSCTDVTQFVLGKETTRSRYVMEPAIFDKPSDPIYQPNAVAAVFKHVDEEFPAPANGSNFLLYGDEDSSSCGSNNWPESVACSLQVSGLGKDFLSARLRLIRPLSSHPEKIFSAKAIRKGTTKLLNEIEIASLLTQENKNAAMHLDLCKFGSDCSNSRNWVVWRSWRFQYQNLAPCRDKEGTPHPRGSSWWELTNAQEGQYSVSCKRAGQALEVSYVNGTGRCSNSQYDFNAKTMTCEPARCENGVALGVSIELQTIANDGVYAEQCTLVNSLPTFGYKLGSGKCWLSYLTLDYPTGSCVLNPDQVINTEGFGPDDIVTAYVHTAMNMQKLSQRSELIKLTTGPLRAALEQASDSLIHSKFLEKRFKIYRFTVWERRDRTPRISEVTFSMDYREQITGTAPSTTTPMVTVELEKLDGAWRISSTPGQNVSTDFFFGH